MKASCLFVLSLLLTVALCVGQETTIIYTDSGDEKLFPTKTTNESIFVDQRYMPCNVRQSRSLMLEESDALVIVTNDVSSIGKLDAGLQAEVEAYVMKDESILNGGVAVIVLSLLDSAAMQQQRRDGILILGHTGNITHDYDDVREFEETAMEAVNKAVAMGFKTIQFAAVDDGVRYPNAELISILGALRAVYVPFEIRQDRPQKARKLESILILSDARTIEKAQGLEIGRFVARDISNGDPERMSPPRVAEYVQDLFSSESKNPVLVSVIKDQDVLAKEFPGMIAVNRAARWVERHQARLIRMEYVGEGPVEETLMFVGKGVTMDTGGLDIKINGAQLGMSRDKSGAAAVAGFFKILETLQPRGLKAIGYMTTVRNSVGAESYSVDEKLTTRSGKRLLVTNTDAEGRIAMMDPLTHMVEMALSEKNPHIFTIATLTGHAYMTYGNGFSVAIDNGPALAEGTSQSLVDLSEQYGDLIVTNRLRREDYETHRGKTDYEDLVQGPNQPSSKTPRGHITPAALLILVSGLDKHETNSGNPIKYTHIDMAGNMGEYPGVPPGAPCVALAAKYVLNRIP